MSDVVHARPPSAPSTHTPRRDREANCGHNVPCETCANLPAIIDKVKKEKVDAIREQNETFQKQLSEIARNRKRLEEERVRTLRQRIRKELEEEMEELRRTWKTESTVAVEEACQETQKQAEREREREIQAVKEASELFYKERMKETVKEAVAQEQRQFKLQTDVLKRQHEEELKSFEEKICAVQEQLKCVIAEKDEFECQFKDSEWKHELRQFTLLPLETLGAPPSPWLYH